MQLFADSPDALHAQTPPLPDRAGWEHGFTYLDYRELDPSLRTNQLVKVDVLGPGPFVVHHLVGPGGSLLAGSAYGITLEPGGQLFHWGRVYFTHLDAALAMVDRMATLDINWFEDLPDMDDLRTIQSFWQEALDARHLADGETLPANWPAFTHGDSARVVN